MSTQDNGGPAFPTANGGSPDNGMSLRDYFAARAMAALIATDEMLYTADGEENDDCNGRATFAYQQADAMLKEREKA